MKALFDELDRRADTTDTTHAYAEEISAFLKANVDAQAADDYHRLLSDSSHHFAKDATAVLIIDPQRSFTRGAWMRSSLH